jgi:hypothetical protein
VDLLQELVSQYVQIEPVPMPQLLPPLLVVQIIYPIALSHIHPQQSVS